MGLLNLLGEVQAGIGEVSDEKYLTDLLQSLELVRLEAYRRLARLDKAPPESDLLTIPQLAARLQVKPSTLYQRVARGHLAATRIGRLVRVREQDAVTPRRAPRVTRLV